MQTSLIKFIFLTIAAGTLVAATPAQKKTADEVPLFFQADKNNIQVLPQRFEYNLVNEDHIKIGDIVIDSTTFGFQIAPSINFPGKYRARFIWPAGLLKDGSLFLKDNTGKAIWTTNFTRKNIHLVNPQPTEQNKGFRTQLAELLVDQLNPALIEDMKYFPFMNLCISRTNEDTRIYLCSKEVYLTKKDNRLTIRARSQGKRTPLVEINGKNVGYQGIIFLNSENENIGFRAITQSGAILEVETRMKPVDFKDVTLSDDKKEMLLMASGTEPVNEEAVKRISNDTWQISLDASRPILYLKGEGNIPMRQEFYIKGNIPSDTMRPFLKNGSFNRIYKSKISLEGTFAPDTTVTANSPNESLEKLSSNKFNWHLTEIPAGESSRHYLRINHDQDTFLAAYDIYRDFPFDIGLLGSYWLVSGQLYADIYANWWIEDFLGSAAAWSRLRWGINLKESLLLNKKEGEANINITHLELLWRANPGFHFQDKTWGLSLPYEVIQASGVNVSSFGLGIFYSDKAQKPYHKYLHWYDLKINYMLGSSGSDVNLKNAFLFDATAYYTINKRMSWNYGTGIHQYSFDSSTSTIKSAIQFKILGGASYRF